MPDHIWGQLLLQVVLIAVNAFFAASEIAVLSLNDNKLKKLAEDGDKKAEKLLRMTEKPEGFLSTIQLGITLAGFLGSAFAAEHFADRICSWLINDIGFTALPANVVNTLAVIVITLILSYFTLVFGELVPKRIAMKKPEAVANATAGIIRGISVVMKPFVALFSASTNGVLRLFGINPKEESEQVTEEEIRMMVDIGEENGTIDSEERDMIENVFEFNNMSAADIMVHRTEISAIWTEDTQEEILSAIEETGLSRFPVYEEDIDNIVGILSTRKYLLNLQSKDPKPFKDILYTPYFVPKTVRADVLFRDMQQKKIHMAIVLDEYGGTSGLITLEDLLEEIVGNIYDEFDPTTEQDIVSIGENLWKVAGSTELDVLYETLDIEHESDDEEFDTLGGLVFSQLTMIPEDGAKVEVETDRLHISVEKIADRRVESAIISVKEPQVEEDDEQKDKKESKDKE